MSSLRSNNGPRIKYTPTRAAPYETITVDKLTPIIGGEIGGVDLASRRQPAAWTRSTARWPRTR